MMIWETLRWGHNALGSGQVVRSTSLAGRAVCFPPVISGCCSSCRHIADAMHALHMNASQVDIAQGGLAIFLGNSWA